MHYTTFAAATYVLLTSVAAYGTNKPVCATKCWTNSQYVSPACGDDVTCLCDDTEFQQAVYQCLYSQCQTAHFGAALHHTLTMCHEKKPSEESNKVDKKKQPKEKSAQPTVPALIRNQIALEKRQNQPMASQSNSRPNQSVSRSAQGSRPVQSVSRSVTNSRNRPTQSVSNSAANGGTTSRAMPMVTQIPDGQIQAPAAIPYSVYMSAMASAPAASQIPDGQVQAPAASQIPDGQVQAPAASQIPDGQVQAPAASQIPDGQVQAPAASQIPDGQVQAPPAASQIPDGQVQAPPAASQIPDGQVQAPPAASQIPDGQVQAPAATGTPVAQIPDGQPQASQGFMKRFDMRGLLGQL